MDIEKLAHYLRYHGPALVLTGAGCSTHSGIPDYRDSSGEWKHRPPVMYDDFIRHDHVRRRYWARSMNGWRRIEAARPNAAHNSLALLEDDGYINAVITQNVDGLHRQAGSRNVIDLHGNLDTVCCLQCRARFSRHCIQTVLLEDNHDFLYESTGVAPDGDAVLDGQDFSSFNVPCCTRCGGLLKPDVVFFGEAIPPERLAAGMKALESAGCLLVVGSSLMVFSGYRYCREAVKHGIPIAAINRGQTRADDLFNLKINAECGGTLTSLVESLCIPAKIL